MMRWFCCTHTCYKIAVCVPNLIVSCFAYMISLSALWSLFSFLIGSGHLLLGMGWPNCFKRYSLLYIFCWWFSMGQQVTNGPKQISPMPTLPNGIWPVSSYHAIASFHRFNYILYYIIIIILIVFRYHYHLNLCQWLSVFDSLSLYLLLSSFRFLFSHIFCSVFVFFSVSRARAFRLVLSISIYQDFYFKHCTTVLRYLLLTNHKKWRQTTIYTNIYINICWEFSPRNMNEGRIRH